MCAHVQQGKYDAATDATEYAHGVILLVLPTTTFSAKRLYIVIASQLEEFYNYKTIMDQKMSI